MTSRQTLVVSGLLLLATAAGPSVVRAERFDCTPRSVSELGNRIHVHCSNAFTPPGSESEVTFIAINKADVDRANRFASLATAALTYGLTFAVDIPVSPASNVAGCQQNNCRTPAAFGISR